MNTTSSDGTIISFDRLGSGPAVVLVQGAFTDRTHPTWAGLAEILKSSYTVFNYDRRGRGESGDTAPYAVEREIEDLEAVIKEAGGSALVFGGSSGAGLALQAAARGLPITKLALWEPPYHVGGSRPALPDDFAEQLADLVAEERRGDAAVLFMTAAADIPDEMAAEMRGAPYWPEVERVAHTLSYEIAVMGRGNKMPAELSGITVPTLVLTGEKSAPWMGVAAKAVSETVTTGELGVLTGQTHEVDHEALAPALDRFFSA
ncbi:alpha/beta fold hydrolase [Nonomuraea sp. MG754425]|uniref:alpha/beta fold hydrolase n=1 Tax=Nonomuraea sp. MG754425 TaxID=2570319 RepID=UPI001F1C15FE|nr:alpha/beta hydrolase [Nonomuraea sp. MG754425]MCF6469973.1 alpha/beta fold hydrolase [Nonomuraea sp. MG754425]